jgi:hypothetical protein
MPDTWLESSESGATVEYRALDAALAPSLLRWTVAGRQVVESYFNQTLATPFTVRVYADRASMEPEWRSVFNAPNMVFQCWMIANASASVVLVLSPRAWSAEACGHSASDSLYVQRILTHEIVHVLHRNVNPDPNLTALFPSWWLVEGLATVASGQFNAGMRAAAANALRDSPPLQLESIWTGAAPYEMSGSLVDYLDATRGRAVLVALMEARDEVNILALLDQDESILLQRWREYVLGQ